MALRLVVSQRARRDILELLTFIAADNQAAARSMRERIDKTMRLLADRPFLGPRAGLPQPALRRFSLPPYVMFYRPDETELAIVRVLHSSMDLSHQEIGGGSR